MTYIGHFVMVSEDREGGRERTMMTLIPKEGRREKRVCYCTVPQ